MTLIKKKHDTLPSQNVNQMARDFQPWFTQAKIVNFWRAPSITYALLLFDCQSQKEVDSFQKLGRKSGELVLLKAYLGRFFLSRLVFGPSVGRIIESSLPASRVWLLVVVADLKKIWAVLLYLYADFFKTYAKATVFGKDGHINIYVYAKHFLSFSNILFRLLLLNRWLCENFEDHKWPRKRG